MSALQIVMLGLLSSGAVVLGYVALMNLALCLPESMWPRANALKLYAIICFGGPPLYLVLSNEILRALSVASLGGFIAALISYFLGQRYESPTLRSNWAQRKPTFFPTAAIVYASFSASFLAISAGWLLSILPVFIWGVLGVTCVELALRREQKRLAKYGRDFSRGMAIEVLNHYQGRNAPLSLFEPDSKSGKYPFP